MKKGFFVTFEGGDGAGKTTLLEGIYRHFLQEGAPVLKTRAPGGTKVGEEIRTLLLHKQELALSPRCELFLFLADRAEHMQQVILPALENGTLVLCDRFNDSTVAYQGVARNLDPTWVRSLCHFATQDREPDLTFYLDINPKEGLARIDRKAEIKDRMESETLAFHQKIREAFHQIADKEPHRVKVLDATISPEDLLDQALGCLHEFFSSSRQ